MDDLIAFVRALLITSPGIIALFRGGPVIVRSPGGESAELYPSIIITAADGPGLAQGEGGEMARSGTMTLTCIDRDADTHLGLETTWPLSNLTKFILEGKEDTTTGVTVGGITNTVLPGGPGQPSAWQVVVCRSMQPSGPQSDPDPLLAKIRQTYKVMLMRV